MAIYCHVGVVPLFIAVTCIALDVINKSLLTFAAQAYFCYSRLRFNAIEATLQMQGLTLVF